MQKELSVLFSLIKEKVLGEKVEAEKMSHVEVLSERLFLLAKRHDYAHLLPEIKSGENKDEINAKIKKEHSLALFRYTQQTMEAEVLYATLDRAGVDFIPLKGAVMREYYDAPYLRTSCDIDILVKPSDLEIAQRALIENGYEKKEVGTHDVSFLSASGVHVELHFALLEGSFKKCDALLDPFIQAKSVKENSHQKRMDDTTFALYHVYHMAKHFMNGGCGIKPFVDLVIIENKMEVVAGKFIKMLEESALVAFYKAVKELIEVWFFDGEHSDLTLNMQAFILGGGVYGDMKQRSEILQVKSGSKIKRLFSRMFVGYRELCIAFPSLRRCPILFPFYQVVRWFKLIFGKDRKRIAATIKVDNSISKEEKDEVKELINQLDLL